MFNNNILSYSNLILNKIILINKMNQTMMTCEYCQREWDGNANVLLD